MTPTLGILSFVRTRLVGAPNATDADQDALAALVGGRVYAGLAPAKDPTTGRAPVYPLIVLTIVSAREVIFQAGQGAWTNALVDVRIISDRSLADAQAVADLAYGLLQRRDGLTADGSVRVMGCHQETSTVLAEADGDRIYHSLVLTFRVRAARAA